MRKRQSGFVTFSVTFYGLLPTFSLIGALFAVSPFGDIMNDGHSSLLTIPAFSVAMPSSFNANNNAVAAALSESLESVKTPMDRPMNDPLPTAVDDSGCPSSGT